MNTRRLFRVTLIGEVLVWARDGSEASDIAFADAEDTDLRIEDVREVPTEKYEDEVPWGGEGLTVAELLSEDEDEDEDEDDLPKECWALEWRGADWVTDGVAALSWLPEGWEIVPFGGLNADFEHRYGAAADAALAGSMPTVEIGPLIGGKGEAGETQVHHLADGYGILPQYTDLVTARYPSVTWYWPGGRRVLFAVADGAVRAAVMPAITPAGAGVDA